MMSGAMLRVWRLGRRQRAGTPGKWTQEYAARWIGVTVRTWARWERAPRVPTYVTRRVQAASRHDGRGAP